MIVLNSTNIKEIKKVVSSIHMGNLLYKSYIKKADDQALRGELAKVLERFEKHVDEFKKLANKFNVKNIERLNLRQEAVLNFQLLKQYKTDFDILADALRGLNMGTIGMLDFIYKNGEMDQSIKKYAEGVLKDYDILKERLHKFGVETYC